MKRIWIILFGLLTALDAAADWRPVATGVDYQSEGRPPVHLFRLDPTRVYLDLLLSKDFNAQTLTASQYRSRGGALLVINGGFFDSAFQSLGLLHRRNQTIHSLRRTSWGVFLMNRDNTPGVIPSQEWHGDEADTTTLAIQAGPRLVVHGKIPNLKESVPDRRSAVGITPDGKVLIAASETLLTLRQWAEFISRFCPDALNLDGGGSTQIAAEMPNLSLQVVGMTGVPNALAVFRK